MSNDRHPFTVAADWLAVCIDCGQEHQEREIGNGYAPTWAAEDGHAYRSRAHVLNGDHAIGVLGVIVGLREAADAVLGGTE